jgi:hypothetical protein
MSLASVIKKASLGNTWLVVRPAQTYTTVGSAYTLFTIAGGPVEIITLGGRITAAATGAETVTTTISGVAGDAGATAINGAVGTVVWIPLNVAGTLLNAAGLPKTIATGTPGMIAGTSVGTIVATFATGTDCTMEWFIVYRKLSPLSRIY